MKDSHVCILLMLSQFKKVSRQACWYVVLFPLLRRLKQEGNIGIGMKPYLKIKTEKWGELEWNIPACLACIGTWVRPQSHRKRTEGKKAGRLDPVPPAPSLFPSLTHVPLHACLFVIVSACYLSPIIHLQVMIFFYEKIPCPKYSIFIVSRLRLHHEF